MRGVSIQRESYWRAVGRGKSWVVAVLLVSAVVLSALVGGACAQSDPFVGAWAVGDYPSPMAIIAKAPADDSYLVTLKPGIAGQAQLRFLRDGDTITGTLDLQPLPPRTFSFTRSQNDTLTYLERDATQTFAKVKVKRVSDSTGLPSPAATGVSP